jgi:hypothetical protein
MDQEEVRMYEQERCGQTQKNLLVSIERPPCPRK